MNTAAEGLSGIGVNFFVGRMCPQRKCAFKENYSLLKYIDIPLFFGNFSDFKVIHFDVVQDGE